jgi:hypothetical protein
MANLLYDSFLIEPRSEWHVPARGNKSYRIQVLPPTIAVSWQDDWRKIAITLIEGF